VTKADIKQTVVADGTYNAGEIRTSGCEPACAAAGMPGCRDAGIK
jgi:hypothetical protein